MPSVRGAREGVTRMTCECCEQEEAVVASVNIDFIPARRGDIIARGQICAKCLRKVLRALAMSTHFPPELAEKDVPDIFEDV
jgi:hypothetical protein